MEQKLHASAQRHGLPAARACACAARTALHVCACVSVLNMCPDSQEASALLTWQILLLPVQRSPSGSQFCATIRHRGRPVSRSLRDNVLLYDKYFTLVSNLRRKKGKYISDLFYEGFHSFGVRVVIRNYAPPGGLIKDIKRAFVEEAVNSVVGGVRLVSCAFSSP